MTSNVRASRTILGMRQSICIVVINSSAFGGDETVGDVGNDHNWVAEGGVAVAAAARHHEFRLVAAVEDDSGELGRRFGAEGLHERAPLVLTGQLHPKPPRAPFW